MTPARMECRPPEDRLFLLHVPPAAKVGVGPDADPKLIVGSHC